MTRSQEHSDSKEESMKYAKKINELENRSERILRDLEHTSDKNRIDKLEAEYEDIQEQLDSLYYYADSYAFNH